MYQQHILGQLPAAQTSDTNCSELRRGTIVPPAGAVGASSSATVINHRNVASKYLNRRPLQKRPWMGWGGNRLPV